MNILTIISFLSAFGGLLTIIPSLPAQTWTQTSAPITNWMSIASSGDGNKLVAVAYGGLTNQGIMFSILPGPIYTSTNSGFSWNQTSAPSKVWQSVTSSYDGSKIAAVPEYGGIYTSMDSGQTWTQSTNAPYAFWGSIAMSADGTTIAATIPGAEYVAGAIYLSTNSGNTWEQTSAPTVEDWSSLAVSADGRKMLAGAIDGWVYFSTNSGTTWTQANLPNIIWGGMAVSSNGNTFIAAVNQSINPIENGGPIYVSTNSGTTWSQSSAPIAGWTALASSADGSRLVAANGGGKIYTSPDSGITWFMNTAPSMGWTSVASSADGTKLVAIVNSGGIYIPMLGIALCSGQVVLSWPTNSMTFQLQQNFGLTMTNWTAVTDLPIINPTNLQYELTVPPTNGSCFYRILPSQPDF